MALSFFVIAIPLVAAFAVALDHIAGRRLGWLLPLVCGGWVAWPRGGSEQNMYGYFVGAFAAAVLLIGYGIAGALMGRRARRQ